MTARFGAAAQALAGHAARALGWRPGEFWAATPAELATALCPPAGAADAGTIARADLQRMMDEDDDGRPG